MLDFAKYHDTLFISPTLLFFFSGSVCGVVNMCSSDVSVEIWPGGGVFECVGYGFG